MQVSAKPGPCGSTAGAITDVARLRVGHFTDSLRHTGCNVCCSQGRVRPAATTIGCVATDLVLG
jgi:L-aminopeptidase/D-esterase-like protein